MAIKIKVKIRHHRLLVFGNYVVKLDRCKSYKLHFFQDHSIKILLIFSVLRFKMIILLSLLFYFIYIFIFILCLCVLYFPNLQLWVFF